MPFGRQKWQLGGDLENSRIPKNRNNLRFFFAKSSQNFAKLRRSSQDRFLRPAHITTIRGVFVTPSCGDMDSQVLGQYSMPCDLFRFFRSSFCRAVSTDSISVNCGAMRLMVFVTSRCCSPQSTASPPSRRSLL